MNILLRYKTIIIRSLGAIMLIVGFAVHFWETPKEGLSENDKAAARVARMESKVKSSGSGEKKSKEKDSSKFMDKMKSTQAKQMQYLTILAMVFGVGFLGYSFISKKEEEV